jgi:predicted GNAT family acetyltransferase
VLFKAEASAWTPSAVQLQQVWVDPVARRRGYGARGMRDLVRLLLATTPWVTLFVRSENTAAIATYESIGMRQVLEYRSVLF